MMINNLFKSMTFTILVLLFPLISLAQTEIQSLDGRIDNEERQMNQSILSNGNNHIYLNSDGKLIKLSISSEPLYVASLCIGSKDQVAVLHASAALGSIDYVLNNQSWHTDEMFEWGLRDTSMTKEALTMRSNYLKNNLWVATTMPMGTKGEIEFIIDTRLFVENEFFLAAGLMPESDPESIIPLPAEGAGDCAESSLVAGRAEPSYSFNPEMWFRVDLNK